VIYKVKVIAFSVCAYQNNLFSLAVCLIHGLDGLDFDIVATENVLQGVEGLFSKGVGPAEDLGVQGPSESVGFGIILRSAGNDDGIVIVVSGQHTGHIGLCNKRMVVLIFNTFYN